jgi:hypothetical protein
LKVFALVIPADVRTEWATRISTLEHEVGAAREWDVLLEAICHAYAEERSPAESAGILQEIRARQARSHQQARFDLRAVKIGGLLSQIDRCAELQGRLDGIAGDEWSAP